MADIAVTITGVQPIGDGRIAVSLAVARSTGETIGCDVPIPFGAMNTLKATVATRISQVLAEAGVPYNAQTDRYVIFGGVVN